MLVPPGSKLCFRPTKVFFADHHGCPISVNDKTSIGFPHILIGLPVVTKFALWLEEAHREKDPQARVTLATLGEGQYDVVCVAGRFVFTGEPLPFQFLLQDLEPPPERLDEVLDAQGKRCITWILEALSAKRVTMNEVSGAGIHWSFPGSSMSGRGGRK